MSWKVSAKMRLTRKTKMKRKRRRKRKKMKTPKISQTTRKTITATMALRILLVERLAPIIVTTVRETTYQNVMTT